jgi:hypothetical protein
MMRLLLGGHKCGLTMLPGRNTGQLVRLAELRREQVAVGAGRTLIRRSW